MIAVYSVCVILLTNTYVETRFENIENLSKMKTITALGTAFSTVVFIVLFASTMPSILQIYRLRRLDLAHDCFKDDRYMQLNEDEEAALSYNLMYTCAVCLLIDFALFLSTFIVHSRA